MSAYDICCGTDEDTGEKGTWIVVKESGEWVKIAKFIDGAYSEEDESLLGYAGEMAGALERLYGALTGLNANGLPGALDEARKILGKLERLP